MILGAKKGRSLGGRTSSSSSPSPSSSPSNATILLYAIASLTVIYAVGIVLWQTFYLNAYGGGDVASTISSTKDAFVVSGGSSFSRNSRGGDTGYSAWFSSDSVGDSSYEEEGSIIPIDLSVNFLKLIERAPGAPPEPPLPPSASNARTPEDFLPIVVPSEVTFRWAHRAKAGSLSEDIGNIKAYRIIVRKCEIYGDRGVVWESKSVVGDEGMPDSVEWGGSKPQVGEILEWQVQVWDARNKVASSEWSKFAVGPEGDINWEGKWIAHPSDMATFHKPSQDTCKLWKRRRPLPLFRTLITSKELMDGEDEISSALLVMTGLGSFRASFDGVPLSTSGPIDPPFTDYSKRVSYRGFDITSFLDGKEEESHVLGVTMGSGWWDHRPVEGMAKPKLLPRGPATIIAQIIITYTSGKTRVVGATGEEGARAKWQVSRGHIRESDLFTGEMVDLSVFGDMEGWDTSIGYGLSTKIEAGNSDPYKEINKWIQPVEYHTEVTVEERVQEMALKAKAMDQSDPNLKSYPRRDNTAAPIGKLVPNEIPPVMAMERIAPDEIHDLGSGRWLIDYGKAFSGMLHFDEGVPMPIAPNEYPRAHGFKAATAQGDSFITVIYGESLEMTTGDINRVLVAGLGLHDGGPRHISKAEGATKNTYCFPDDHDAILSQKDVYIVSSKASEEKSMSLFAQARQSHFTTHSFRFAEVCCSAEPPQNAHALVYRTAVEEWGKFDSSNVRINGGYELVKNAMVSNMLSVQSDCPHREKLPYGGDLVADSPAAMHLFDMSSFYKKTVYDWLDSQWDNGAYTETSVWQDLNDDRGIGHGAGETVWASAPPVLTVRHMQHYGDIDLLKKSLPSHVRWVDFLDKFFDTEMLRKGYDEELDQLTGGGSGLGDWLAMRTRDCFLTHTAFYMASGRCVAYIARKLGMDDLEEKGMAVAKKLQDRIAHLYLKNGKDNFDPPKGGASWTPGPEMSLFARIVPGEKRCIVLKNWFKRSGSTWPGNEENLFLKELDDSYKDDMLQTGELTHRGKEVTMGWSQWQGFNEGIFGMRYGLKTLSDMGFHNVALQKASGFGFATTEYMIRHNATTMWESWWRSEDLYSRNHPMLGALAEWMSSSAAGVSHYPTTTGSKKMLFWPRFPKSAWTLQYASATQGTVKGDYSIAWRFEGLSSDKSEYSSAKVSVRVRLLIPPGGEAVFRSPIFTSSTTTATLRQAIVFPDLVVAQASADEECKRRRKARLGFPYSWEYDRIKQKWYKHESGKAIGTPCESFLFDSSLNGMQLSKGVDFTEPFSERYDVPIEAGLYEVLFTDWQLEPEVKGTGRIGNLPEYYDSDNVGPYCEDSNTFEWQIDDGTHII